MSYLPSPKSNFQAGYSLSLLAICLVAFALRLHLLEDIFWQDDEEVSQILYVQQPASWIVTHYDPNNHWLTSALGYLMRQLGPQRFLLRWPSLLFGTLAVPLMSLAAAWLFQNKQTGLLAAWLLGLSAFHEQWSQQFRGYSALLLFTLLAFVLLQRALQTGRLIYWAGFLAGMALAIASHLYGVLMLIAIVIMLLSWSGWRFVARDAFLPQQRWALLISLLALAPIGYLIWFGKTHIINLHHPPPTTHLIQLIQYQWLAFIPTLPEIRHFLKELAVAFTAQGNEVLALALFWGLAGSGLALSLPRFPRSTLFLGLWLMVPITGVIVAEFAVAGFFVSARYLIFILPAWLLLVSRSLTAGSAWLAGRLTPIARQQSAASLLILVAGLGYLSLLNLNTIRAYFADRAGADWRSVAAYLAQHIGPTDLILCKQLPHHWPPNLENKCTKELRRRLAALDALPQFPIQQLERVATPDVGLQFKDQAQLPGTVWLILWGVDVPVVSAGVGSETGWAFLWGRSTALAAPLSAEPPALTFDRLGYTTLLKSDSGPTRAANLEQALADLADLDRLSPARFDYYLRQAQILAYQGRAAEAQAALETARGLLDDHPEAIAYLSNALQRIPGFNPPLSTPAHRLKAEFGDPATIRLAGYTLPPTFHAGQTILITLFWQPLAPIADDYTIFLHLHTNTGQTAAQLDFRPFDGAYPTSDWLPGSTIEETRLWSLPPDLPAGVYTLHLGLYQVETQTRLLLIGDQSGQNAVRLGAVWVK